MPKMKTHSSLKGRFKITGTGKVMRYKQGKNHLLSGKSARQKRVSGHEPNYGSMAMYVVCNNNCLIKH